ncbi:MAG: hypothetical protein ACR5LD_03910 [Symbiopectobacterium sp.]
MEYPSNEQPALSEAFGATVVENDVLKRNVIKRTFKCVDGFMEIPTAPGIGIELADDVAENIPIPSSAENASSCRWFSGRSVNCAFCRRVPITRRWLFTCKKNNYGTFY